MTRESARWMDISSFWTLGAAEAAGESYRPPMAYPEPGGMLAFAPFHWFIWGMSVNINQLRRWNLPSKETRSVTIYLTTDRENGPIVRCNAAWGG